MMEWRMTMGELQETMVVNGYNVTFYYNRENPQYVIHDAFYATNKREIMITLKAIWNSRGYNFLVNHYNYRCSHRLQFYIWAETIWRYRHNPRNNILVTVKNKYCLLQKIIFALRASLIP